jgi:hypothetical protein
MHLSQHLAKNRLSALAPLSAPSSLISSQAAASESHSKQQQQHGYELGEEEEEEVNSLHLRKLKDLGSSALVDGDESASGRPSEETSSSARFSSSSSTRRPLLTHAPPFINGEATPFYIADKDACANVSSCL